MIRSMLAAPRRRIPACGRAATSAVLAAILMLGGCHYYQVNDPESGRVYYTDRWVAADGYHGPLSFQDHLGHRVELRRSRVVRLSARDYQEATGGAPAGESTQQGKSE